jgi:tRNA-specific 2-thiouridylase
MAAGADGIATGHYAQTRLTGAGEVELIRGADPNKDQTYFLHRLNQSQLARTVFPIGDLLKTEVREMAHRIGLPNAAKKDSTGICFIGERPFREFLNRYVASTPGPMKTPQGRTIGQHMGLAFYTLGQRKGLGIGGDKAGTGEPWFVLEKDLANNTLIVDQGHDHPGLMSGNLSAIDASWVAGKAPADGAQLAAKTRYRQADAACVFRAIGDGVRTASTDAPVSAPAPSSGFALQFHEPQWAVTPGQSAVIYDGPVCLGGGIISAATSSAAPTRA